MSLLQSNVIYLILGLAGDALFPASVSTITVMMNAADVSTTAPLLTRRSSTVDLSRAAQRLLLRVRTCPFDAYRQ